MPSSTSTVKKKPTPADLYILKNITTVASLAASVIVLFASWNAYHKTLSKDATLIDNHSTFFQRKIIATTVLSLSALLWPMVFGQLVGFDSLVHWPGTMIGMLWPIVASLRDLVSVNRSDTDNRLATTFAPLATRTDAGTMVTVSLALGSLLTSQLSPELSKRTIPYVMYALALLIGVVVPSPPGFTKNDFSGLTNETATHSAIATSAVRRVSLHWAIGFMLTALLINIQKGPLSKKPEIVK